jgi:hypothetical protein
MGLLIISIAKRLDGALDVGAPTIQRLFAFSEEFVPLVDGSYTGNRPFLVVENLIGNMRRHSKARHAGNYGSSEVMQPPSGDAGQLIKCAL